MVALCDLLKRCLSQPRDAWTTGLPDHQGIDYPLEHFIWQWICQWCTRGGYSDHSWDDNAKAHQIRNCESLGGLIHQISCKMRQEHDLSVLSKLE